MEANQTKEQTIKKETIVVDLDKIEKLINKVADLVITNSMMTQNIENLQNDDDKKKMQDTTILFERHIKEMQDYAMELRMISMSDIYKDFPQLVKNLSKEHKKEIELKISGENTKIDKSMIDSLSIILNDILEKAVIKGIETPEQREKKGKNRKGNISINTEQINGQIVITFTNDGKGIDLKRIEQNALEEGIITQDDLHNMNENEKDSLILQDKSMSSIKQNIDMINGSMTIDTKKGVGTSITIFIPLTLSILDGLNIRIGNKYYILPTASIIESLQPKPDIIKAVGDGTSELLMLREDFIPIIRMYEYLNIKSDYKKLEQGILIVVKAGEEKVALFIDEFLHQQQIVVKPIDKNFKEVIGISGATVRGNSSIGLIIDVQSIIDDKRDLFDAIKE